MTRPFIRVGDKTDHGGTVTTGAPTSISDGQPVARIGDLVTCPHHHHKTNAIVTGDANVIVDGQPVARHNDKTACGASLIAGQRNTSSGE